LMQELEQCTEAYDRLHAQIMNGDYVPAHQAVAQVHEHINRVVKAVPRMQVYPILYNGGATIHKWGNPLASKRQRAVPDTEELDDLHTYTLEHLNEETRPYTYGHAGQMKVVTLHKHGPGHSSPGPIEIRLTEPEFVAHFCDNKDLRVRLHWDLSQLTRRPIRSEEQRTIYASSPASANPPWPSRPSGHTTASW
jgi:hypothetical protein